MIVLSNDESKKYVKTLRNEFSSLISQYEETLLDVGSYGPLYLFAIYLVTTVFNVSTTQHTIYRTIDILRD